MKLVELLQSLQEEKDITIDSKFNIDDESLIVIYTTNKDKKSYYAIIIDGNIWQNDGTGHKYASDALKDIICMGEVWG